MFICLLMKIHKLQFSVKHKSQSRYSVCTPRVTIIVCVPENCAGLYSIQHSTKLPLICGNKIQTRCNRYLLQILLLAQRVWGTIMPIIRSWRVLYRWSLPVVFLALVFKLSVWCGAEGCVSGLRALELLIMGIMVPETCWASNKICNKNHLLHLVGILFPHINDDARSKPHQTVMYC